MTSEMWPGGQFQTGRKKGEDHYIYWGVEMNAGKYGTMLDHSQ